MSKKIWEEEVTRKAQTKDFAKILKQVLPLILRFYRKKQNYFANRVNVLTPVKRRVAGEELLPSIETVYETTPKRPKLQIATDEDDDDDVVEEEVKVFGRNNFVEKARPYLTPYIYNVRYLDRQYGIRREDDGRFMTDDSTLCVDDATNISLKGNHFKGTRGYGSY
jgi:hypothetical protein